jgi:hypothetical protein
MVNSIGKITDMKIGVSLFTRQKATERSSGVRSPKDIAKTETSETSLDNTNEVIAENRQKQIFIESQGAAGPVEKRIKLTVFQEIPPARRSNLRHS